jgi:hypothetical protein
MSTSILPGGLEEAAQNQNSVMVAPQEDTV